jgi:NAD dependent epimerase/dehydratase family protein
MKKKILVFGATGNLGAPIAVYLNENGYDVIAVGHRTSDNGFFGEIGVPYYSVNIEREEDFNKLPTKDIYAVAHFASSLPSRYEYDPVELFESITIGTLNVLKWMNKIGCKKIVFPQTPSDMDSYHNCGKVIPEDKPREFPLTGDHAVYTIAKNAAVDLIDHYHAEFGFSRFIFRFFTIYEYHPNPYHYRNYKHLMMPFRMLMDRASKGLPIEIWGNCKKAKEMVYIKDFVRLVKLAIDSDLEGGIYNVGNGWQVTLEEQILGIIQVFSPKDKKSPVIYLKEKPDPLENAFDITKIKRDFNFEPHYTYIQQLEDFKREMELEPFAKLWGKKEDYKL